LCFAVAAAVLLLVLLLLSCVCVSYARAIGVLVVLALLLLVRLRFFWRVAFFDGGQPGWLSTVVCLRAFLRERPVAQVAHFGRALLFFSGSGPASLVGPVPGGSCCEPVFAVWLRRGDRRPGRVAARPECDRRA
jgi:hypothetical protein